MKDSNKHDCELAVRNQLVRLVECQDKSVLQTCLAVKKARFYLIFKTLRE